MFKIVNFSTKLTTIAKDKYQKAISISIDDYLRPNGLLWHNLESYIDKEDDKLRKRSQYYHKYQLFVIGFHFLSVIKNFSLWFISDKYIQEVMLDLGPNLKCKSLYPALLTSIWSSFALWISIIWYYFQQKGRLAFMEPFVAIKFPELKLSKLSHEIIVKLDKRFRIGVSLTRFQIQVNMNLKSF